jgi:hypothetical protein
MKGHCSLQRSVVRTGPEGVGLSLFVPNLGSPNIALETKHYAHSIFGSLTKLGVVDASTGRPDTTKIDKNFVSKISIISVPKQRELADLLFWWEEELTRWRLLDEEQAEIEGVTSAAGEGSLQDEAELQERMQVIEAKRRVLPSLRKSDGSLKATEEQPPEHAS